MSVLIDKKTKVIVQGITGTQASFHVQRAIKYGTKIVGGVVPNKSDDQYLGIPLFSSVAEAKETTGATASVVFVPARYAKAAILEAIHAEMELVVVITSHIPVSDMMEIKQELLNSKTILIGPNTPGVITPNQAYMGIFPDNIHKNGNIGIISRSSTLTYEVVLEINKIGYGESTVVGLGDDFIIGTSFPQIIEKFENDKETETIVIIAGSGGNYEDEAAKIYMNSNFKKKVIALLLDNHDYASTQKGLATEIMCRGVVTLEDKKELLRKAGIVVVDSVDSLKEELLKL